MPVTDRYFVDPTNGTDSVAGVANGRDPLGLSLVNATYDHTGNGEGERHLSLTSAFASYTFTAGDTIYLVNAAGGVADGLYEIASKVDSDAILLATDSGLTADSTSDVDSSDGPWATTQYALDTVTATPSDIYLMSTATETPSAEIRADTNLNSEGSPIRLIGAGSTGIALTTGQYTISGTSLSGSEPVFRLTTTAFVLDLQRVRVTNSTHYGILTVGSVHVRLKDCIIDTHTNDGVRGDTSSCTIQALRTEVYGCSTGYAQSTTDRVRVYLSDCSIHDCTNDGVDAASIEMHRCQVYDNSGSGVLCDDNEMSMTHCTIYGNDGDGIEYRLSSDNLRMFANNTISLNGGYGINTKGGGFRYESLHSNNHAYNNTSGATDAADGLLPGDNNQTGDPLFTSVVDGSEDFTPTSGSPLLGNGTNGADIGAIPGASGGGGGGISQGLHTIESGINA